MCIYCTTTNYRKIYENHHGLIPKEADGRSYEIHHIDGNHSNNNPENLKAVTLQEHYDIHLTQGDHAASHILAVRLHKSHEEISKLASKAQEKRLNDGTHNFLDSEFQRTVQNNRVIKGTHHFLDKSAASRRNRQRIENGTHHFIGDNHPSKVASQNGTHNWAGGNIQRESALRRIANGTDNSQWQWTCPHCGKEGRGKVGFVRWHDDNCKHKTNN